MSCASKHIPEHKTFQQITTGCDIWLDAGNLQVYLLFTGFSAGTSVVKGGAKRV